MGGAILAHLTKIGIEYHNDDGLLFGSAIFIFIVGNLVLISERKHIPFFNEIKHSKTKT